MPNSIGNTGLTVKTAPEIVADLTTEMQGIFGTDINVDSNSPDGQLINIFAQAAVDNLELLMDVYNSFTVPASYGVLLDQRVALNGLTRRQGTYTQAEVSLVINQSITLVGQDALITDPTAQPYTVSDNTGNQFQLKVTATLGAGTHVETFQAVAIGQVETIANTITNQVTTILGVTSVNNPSTASDVIGVNEESDAELKVRHSQSFALASTGPADSVAAALLAIPDVTDAFVVENDTNNTVSGTGAHSIWCIVAGGTDAEIGTAIYSKKAPGCGMRGGESYTVARPNGTNFVALWDTALPEDLYVQFAINPISGGGAFDNDAIKTALVAALRWTLGQSPNIGQIIAAMQTIAPLGYLTGVGVSDDGMSYLDVVTPTSPLYYLVLDVSRIDIS